MSLLQFPECRNPVFIVGAPRTASSFLCSALISHGGLLGHSEGHILPLAADLDRHVRGYYAHLRSQGLLGIDGTTVDKVNESAVRLGVKALFDQFQSTFFGGGRWVDKTVNTEMIEALPYLMAAWPESRVINLNRNGISNVQSAIKYFNVGFEECCDNWANCGDTWHRSKPLLVSERVLELEQEQFLNDPAGTARTVAHFLALDDDREEGFTAHFVESAKTWLVPGRNLTPDLGQTGWSSAQCRYFLLSCGKEMLRQGYYTESQYSELRHRYSDSATPNIDLTGFAALAVDAPEYFQCREDIVYVVPGRKRAAVLSYDELRCEGRSRLEGVLGVIHHASDGVRFEFVGACSKTGRIALSGQIEVAALEQIPFALDIQPGTASIDLVVRVCRGINAASNDYSWGAIRDLCLR